MLASVCKQKSTQLSNRVCDLRKWHCIMYVIYLQNKALILVVFRTIHKITF